MSRPPPFEQQITFLRATDLKRSHEFYAGVLRLDLVLDQGDCRIYSLSESAFVGLCLADTVDPTEGVIVTLVTEKVDEWCVWIQRKGVVLESGPVLNDRFGIYHAFLRDPDGNRLEIQRFVTPQWPSLEDRRDHAAE